MTNNTETKTDMETKSNIAELEACLASGDLKGAGEIFKVALAEKPTDGDQAEAIISLTETYLDLSNRVNGEYRDALQTVVQNLEKLGRSEAVVNDIARLTEVRGSLNI